MNDSAIHWICIDVVGTADLEAPVRVEKDRPFRLAQSAAYVNVGDGVVGDEPGVLAAPRTDHIGNGCTGRVVTRECEGQ